MLQIQEHLLCHFAFIALGLEEVCSLSLKSRFQPAPSSDVLLKKYMYSQDVFFIPGYSGSKG